MAKRRGHGEGGIYHRESDGKWRASVDLGFVNGKCRRKVIYGKTRKEVADKLLVHTNLPGLPEQVQEMLNQLTERGLPPRTVRNVRAVLRDALNQAVKRRRISFNVALLV